MSEADLKWRRHCEGRLTGLRTNRYSWWTHARELADYLPPRRYKWLINPEPNGARIPINQHILDSTGTLAARNLASGLDVWRVFPHEAMGEIENQSNRLYWNEPDFPLAS